MMRNLALIVLGVLGVSWLLRRAQAGEPIETLSGAELEPGIASIEPLPMTPLAIPIHPEIFIKPPIDQEPDFFGPRLATPEEIEVVAIPGIAPVDFFRRPV
jgi:hypothetical protein